MTTSASLAGRVASPGPDQPAPRSRAVDAVRGLVMVVMALDHVRDYLGHHHVSATDLAHTTIPLFLSRWITHFCAPSFFLLAGISAYLSLQSGRRTLRAAARFLLLRGLALVIVEQTVLRCLGWYFHFDYHFMNAGVLYGLGLAMVAMSALVWLPPSASLALGLAIILGEPAIARLDLGDGVLGTIAALATQSRDFEPVPGYHFFVSYPPIPWLGAMAFGYGLAAQVYRPSGARTAHLFGGGAALLALFLALRALGLGDPSPWSSQPSPSFTALSFVNVSKYPPSTAFLLLTLGAALLALGAFERRTRATPILETLGRVPLFFYLLHIPVIHAIAVVYSWLAFGRATWLTSGPVIFWDVALPGSPASYGVALPWVYAITIAVVAALFPLCRWYERRVPNWHSQTRRQGRPPDTRVSDEAT